MHAIDRLKSQRPPSDAGADGFPFGVYLSLVLRNSQPLLPGYQSSLWSGYGSLSRG